MKVMVDAFTDLLSSRLAMRGKMITGANHTYIYMSCIMYCIPCGNVYTATILDVFKRTDRSDCEFSFFV